MSRPRGGARAVLAVLIGSLPLLGASPAGADASACSPGRSPFAEVAGASMTATLHTSKDAAPVRYVLWRGTVPSFDGLPLSVDVTVPCPGQGGAGAGPLPAVTMLHGFTDDKTVWEETGHSDTVGSPSRPGSNARWNNIWFAGRGYAVLTYTARGWRDSCGPDTPGASASAPPPRCVGHEYWIHLDDKRWEVRDAQWLTGALVQGGIADPARLAITGGSYGGAPTASAALLAGTIVCGAAPQPAALGPDPCAGVADGGSAPWTTPDGTRPLGWAAALPLYTFSDLLQVLAPNGRAADGWSGAPADASHTDPFGVPLASTLSGLVLAGQAAGALAPRGGDLSSDILTTADRLLAGDPFPQDEPVVAAGIDAYQRFKSPISTAPRGRVPIFWVQGHTDSLFGGREALAMRSALLAADPGYPIKVFLGDIGHDVAAERQDDWDLVKAQMNAFLDHYLRPDRTPQAPAFDVGVSLARCLDPGAAQTYLHAARWEDLHPATITLRAADVGTTSTRDQGPSGIATDPISTATLPGPDSYKGCRIRRSAATDPTVAAADLPLARAATVVGGPVIALEVTTSAPDAPVAVRVWDVAPDGSAEGLVTRGVYRLAGAAPGDTTIRFQLATTAYRFAAGHRVRVEVTGNDSPYLLANNRQADITVRGLTLSLPEYRSPPRVAAVTGASHRGGVIGAGWVVGSTALGVVLGLGGWAALRRRRGRPTPAD